MHKWMEEWYDTLLYILFISGLLIFFLCYWGGEYRLRSAEMAITEFLDEVSAEGKIDIDVYGELADRVQNINPEYKLNIYTVEYALHPIYDYVSQEKITEYFMERNVKKEKELQKWQQMKEQERADRLSLQLETNASILAAEQMAGIPLPESEEAERIEAICPYQEVYEGEELITICKVIYGGKSYFAIAESLQAKESGVIELKLNINGEIFFVPVTVLCHSRYVICEKGHKVVNTKKLIEETKLTGQISCSYCAAIPENVQCSTSIVRKKTGESLTKDDVCLIVTYLNGTSDIITPDSVEWKDTFDELYCGIQTVYVSYRGLTEWITVITENDSCKKCGGACNERNREDYNFFPYCTICMSDTTLFTGEVYEEKTYTELFESLITNENKEVVLEKGDFIVVQLSEEGKLASLMQKEILQDGQKGESK